MRDSIPRLKVQCPGERSGKGIQGEEIYFKRHHWEMCTWAIARNYGLEWCRKNDGMFLNSWHLTGAVWANSARISDRVIIFLNNNNVTDVVVS